MSIAGGRGTAKGLIAGLDRETNEITTLHLKPVSFLEKRAPSLSWFAQPKTELTDLIGDNSELGWTPQYRRFNP